MNEKLLKAKKKKEEFEKYLQSDSKKDVRKFAEELITHKDNVDFVGLIEDALTLYDFENWSNKSNPAEVQVSQKTADLDFGDYCLIEQNRFGSDNEMYLHKVIGQLESNSYVDIPVTGTARETLHDKSVKVIRAITCGVEEKIALKYKLEEVKINSRFSG